MKRPLSTTTIICYLTWLSLLGVILYLVFFLYHYTSYQHPDTGWQLYSAWAVATGGGQHIDFLMSYRPAFLLNVPIVWLWGINLWAMRCFMMALAAVSIAWLIIAINPTYRHSSLLPLAILTYLLSILFFTDYIISYYTAIPIGLTASLASYHHAQRTAKPILYLIVSGILIALTMLMNIAIIPAGIISVIIFASLLTTQRWVFIASALITLIISTSGYLYGLNVIHLWLQAAQNLHWLHKTTPTIIHQLPSQLLIGILFFTLSALPGLLGWAVGRFVVQHYATKIILMGIIVISIGFIIITVSQGQGEQHIKIYPYEYIVAASFALGLLWALLYNITTPLSYQTLLLSGLIILFYLNHRATSQNIIGSIFSLYYSVILLYLTAQYWHHVTPAMRGIMLWLLALFTIAIPTLTNLYPANVYQHPRPIWYNTTDGPYHTKIPTYTAGLYHRFMQLYTTNHCQHVFFFSYFDTPMGYILTQRYAPFNQSWVSHINFNPINGSLNQHALVNKLNHTKQWCVLYGNTSVPTLTGNPHYLADIITYLQLYSDNVQIVGFNPSTDQDYWLYSKTSR